MNLTIISDYVGCKTEYRAVIRTYYGRAVMPEYISLYKDIGDTTQVRIRDMTLGTTYSEDENGEVTMDMHVKYISATELKDFYNNIADDHLYDVQTNDGDLYRGYMSKSNKYACAYIFTPTYDYYLEEDFAAAASKPQTAGEDLSGVIMNSVLENGIVIVDNLMDYHIRLHEDKVAQAFEITLDNSGEYHIQTYSNGNHRVYYAASETKDIDDADLIWKRITDTAEGKTIQYSDGQKLFIVCYAGDLVDIILNLHFNDSTDSTSNFIYEVNANDIFTTMNETLEEKIDYLGDADVFMLNCDYDGKYSIILNNLLKESKLTMEIYTLESDNFCFYVEEATKLLAGEEIIFDYDFPLSTEARYFVCVYSRGITSGVGDYDIEFRTPKYKDIYEPNNLEATATDLSTLTSPISDAVLSRSDKDIYKIEVGSEGAEVDFKVTSNCSVFRTLSIQSESGNFSAEGETDGNVYTISTTLPENDTYYLWIWAKASEYCPGHPYLLEWEIISLNPYAITMKRDVELEIEAGAADTAELLMPVAQTITCTNDGATVNTTTKMANMQLYYDNDGVLTEITDDNTNDIPVGTYSVTAKLYGLDVAGKTITLTVY